MSHSDILSQIKSGREGWVYLIHAVGTNRYKIGRSVHSEFHSLTGAMIIQLTSKAFDVEQEEVGHE